MTHTITEPTPVVNRTTFESLVDLLETVGPTNSLSDIQRAEFNRLYRELQDILNEDAFTAKGVH